MRTVAFVAAALMSACVGQNRLKVTIDAADSEDTRPDSATDTQVDPADTPIADVGDLIIECDGGCGTGDCVDGTCVCAGSWTGPNCELPACEPACEGNMRCAQNNRCECPPGEPCATLSCENADCMTLTGLTPRCNPAGFCDYVSDASAMDWQADIVWTAIPPGTFPMGAPQQEASSQYSRPALDVTFTQGFLIGTFELTTRTYEACMAAGECQQVGIPDLGGPTAINRSSDFRGLNPQNALTRSDAEDACAFIGARLPTAAEWEYAAKGPNVHRQYPWGAVPSPVCNVHAVFQDDDCPGNRTEDVGHNKRIAGASYFGVLDMAGNVAEWVEDCFHGDYNGAPSDGTAWTTGCFISQGETFGVTRGGGFRGGSLRAATVTFISLKKGQVDSGVRCVRDLP